MNGDLGTFDEDFDPFGFDNFGNFDNFDQDKTQSGFENPFVSVKNNGSVMDDENVDTTMYPLGDPNMAAYVPEQRDTGLVVENDEFQFDGFEQEENNDFGNNVEQNEQNEQNNEIIGDNNIGASIDDDDDDDEVFGGFYDDEEQVKPEVKPTFGQHDAGFEAQFEDNFGQNPAIFGDNFGEENFAENFVKKNQDIETQQTNVIQNDQQIRITSEAQIINQNDVEKISTNVDTDEEDPFTFESAFPQTPMERQEIQIQKQEVQIEKQHELLKKNSISPSQPTTTPLSSIPLPTPPPLQFGSNFGFGSAFGSNFGGFDDEFEEDEIKNGQMSQQVSPTNQIEKDDEHFEGSVTPQPQFENTFDAFGDDDQFYGAFGQGITHTQDDDAFEVNFDQW